MPLHSIPLARISVKLPVSPVTIPPETVLDPLTKTKSAVTPVTVPWNKPEPSTSKSPETPRSPLINRPLPA